MTSFAWESLSGTITPDGFALTSLIQASPQFALFRAHAASKSSQPEALVEVVQPHEDRQTVLNRFHEAGFLRHGNLAGISAAGILEPHGLIYAVAEPIEQTLSELISRGPLTEADAEDLVLQLVSALAFLHSENLVFCNLRPEAIWRTASEWKLGDFSQLRVIGSGNSRDLRAALARRPDLPPEVYEGVVSPAWDVWSLGVLLRRIFAPQPSMRQPVTGAPRVRQLRNAEMPAPFDTITRDCLDPDVNARITLNEVVARLRPAVAPAGARARAQLHQSIESEEQDNRETEEPDNRLARLVRRLPGAKPEVKAVVALIAAVLILAVLMGASAMLRRGQSEAPKVARVPSGTVSEADREARAPVAGLRPSVTPSRTGAEDRILPIPPASPLPEAVKALLDTWVSSTRAHNVRANLDCYAPMVDAYYTKKQLNREQLRREKERQFRTIGTVHRYGLENVQYTRLSSERAVVLFDKQWSFGDKMPFSGAERSQLNLQNVNGQWKISGERELKVYWTKRG